MNHIAQTIASALGESKADLVIKNAGIFNVFTGEIETGDLAVTDGYITGIGSYSGNTEIDGSGKVIVPGFIDGHIHLESTTVTPLQFCKAVLPHGTTAVITDPHEIANVCGKDGIDYILNSTMNLPLDVFVVVPSCVPATAFDETGYTISSEDVAKYLENDRVLGLAELMNYPGVIFRDSEVLSKVKAAKDASKLIDGHAPGLTGNELNAYIASGVYSDHECTRIDEAIEKLKRGQWIMVREGTASRNLSSLIEICDEPYCHRALFVTDDKHPGDLARDGEIDHIIRKAISLGANPASVYQMATINAATYFNLAGRGALCPGYMADFVVLSDFETCRIESVYKNGLKVTDNEDIFNIPSTVPSSISDTIHCNDVTPEDFNIDGPAKVIGVIPGELLTTDEGESDCIDISRDILKLAVVERHHNTGHIGKAYVTGYGLKSGAIATSIAHDSHNIICVGTNDEDMASAVMELKKIKGGMVVIDDGKVIEELSLPIGGLMCDLPVEETQDRLDALKNAARNQGVHEGIDPFMTLSFASLPVIPDIKLTTLGVFDVLKFSLV